MQFAQLRQNEQLDGQMFDDEMELMTANLLKIKRQITERKEDINSDDDSNIQKPSLQLDNIRQQIRQKYDTFLTENNLPNNHQQKLGILLEKQIQIGSTVALFQMLYYFRQAVNEDIIYQIAQKVGRLLIAGDISKALNRCLIQLFAICGVYDESVINFIIEQMIEEQFEFQICFILLSNVGFPGIAALIHLARQDFKQISIKILDYLSRTDQIIKELLVPILIQDLTSAKVKEKDIILAILNRLNSFLTSKQQIFPILIEMMQNNSFDRGMVASVLRSAGPDGQKILLQFMNQPRQNDKILFPIVTVLPWRAKIDPALRIRVIQYSLGSNFLPGTLYQYEGKIQPSAFSTSEDQCLDSLCLNARDFIAALQRLISLKVNSFENQQSIRKTDLNNKKLFMLHQIICGDVQEQVSISGQVINVLNKSLTHKNPQIVEAGLNSLGLIGLPQAFESIQDIQKCLWNSDSRNRSMACWALSKICEQPNKKIISRLIELLKDNFWKVRTSACICIGKIVKKPYQNVVEALVKCLKDGSINKTTVCQSIMQLGPVGEQILLQILKTASNNDFKLKQAAIYCLRSADVKSPSIDFVLQQLFKHCKGSRVQTRTVCLQTLNRLRIRAVQQEEQIIYLKAKSILPFYYYFLEDSSSKIRDTAMESIYSFGNQAQLIFIEGITKGSPLVRIQSAKGLGKLGVQNFRALILGLRDEDSQVKKISADVILGEFSVEDIVSYYSMKANQAISLLCNLKDMLISGGYRKDIKAFLKELIYKLEININKDGKYYDENSVPNSSQRVY